MELAAGLFLMGLASGMHCLGMCGGIATAFPVNKILFNLGRIATYTMLGAAAGLLGAAILPGQALVHVAFNLALILIGLQLAGVNLRAMESLGAPLWRRVQPYAVRFSRQNSLLAGMAWGFVPCGLVYAAATASAFAANPLESGLAMLAFGAGTLPWLLPARLRRLGTRARRCRGTDDFLHLGENMERAIHIIRDEHRSISAVLDALKHLARMAVNSAARPRFAVFRSALRYLDEYPERMHHPKEEAYLFTRVMQRCPDAVYIIEKLRADHLRGEKLIRALERKLLFLEDSWPEGAREFSAAVDEYAQFHWDHMTREERDLLPIARQYLTADDWEVIGDAFAHNRDPIAGLEERDYEKLISRIASLAPAPVGLGEPWRKSA
jgi:hemerythrin-like domain-containing protein